VKPLASLLDQWKQLKQADLNSLNEQLKRDHLAVITLDTREFDRNSEDELEMGDED
jgi:hypothetical protein